MKELTAYKLGRVVGEIRDIETKLDLNDEKQLELFERIKNIKYKIVESLEYELETELER